MLNPSLLTPRPFFHDADSSPQPSFEQVAKSMARALRFFTPCFHIQERQCQIEEGRKMARSEFGHTEHQASRENINGSNRSGNQAPRPRNRRP